MLHDQQRKRKRILTTAKDVVAPPAKKPKNQRVFHSNIDIILLYIQVNNKNNYSSKSNTKALSNSESISKQQGSSGQQSSQQSSHTYSKKKNKKSEKEVLIPTLLTCT